MLAKLGEFAFIMNENHFKTIDESYKFDYAEHKALNNHSSVQAVGSWSHDVTLKGLLVAKRNNSLSELIEIAKKKDSVRFTNFEHDFFVVITDITQGKDKLIPNGKFMTQSFSIKIKRVFNNG